MNATVSNNPLKRQTQYNQKPTITEDILTFLLSKPANCHSYYNYDDHCNE